MFRQYEDPWMLEDRVAEEEAKLEQMKLEGASDEAIADQYLTVYELKDRVRFAWDDQEYDENYELYGWN